MGTKALAIIGGGAAGLAAAIAAARRVRAAGGDGAAAEVVLYEADERVGRSILATGNGRCNFSNSGLELRRYRNNAFVEEALWALSSHPIVPRRRGEVRPVEVSSVLDFFESLGLLWREEDDGRLYPQANKATSVLDVLRAAAADAGVRTVCDRRAVRVDAPDGPGGRYHIRFADHAVEHADAVVVAVGGRAAAGLALPGGLACTPQRPVLGPLLTDTQAVKPLNNIRVKCAVSLWRRGAALRKGDAGGVHSEAVRAAAGYARSIGREAPRKPYCDEVGRTLLCTERGEVLFRDYGVSGIAVFNLSRFAEPGDELLIDFFPYVRRCDFEAWLFSRRRHLEIPGEALTCERFLSGALLPAVARAVLAEAGLSPAAPFAKADVPALARALKAFPLTVRGTGDARQCQVMRGGLPVDAFDGRTLAARAVPGLYAAGEAIDVDAPCGGYNLHWAWSSGMLAGHMAAEGLVG